MPLGSINVQGYGFLVSLLYETKLYGARIAEIPIQFVDRTRGTSKLGLRDIAEFILNVSWLRFRSSAVLIKFLLVGASGVVVNLGMFTLLLMAGMNKYVASPIAIEVSILTNFLLHNIWTFRWRKKRDAMAMRGLKFNIVSFASLAVSYTTFLVLSAAFPNAPPQLHQLVGIVPATLVNYFLNSYWTFRAE